MFVVVCSYWFSLVPPPNKSSKSICVPVSLISVKANAMLEQNEWNVTFVAFWWQFNAALEFVLYSNGAIPGKHTERWPATKQKTLVDLHWLTGGTHNSFCTLAHNIYKLIKNYINCVARTIEQLWSKSVRKKKQSKQTKWKNVQPKTCMSMPQWVSNQKLIHFTIQCFFCWGGFCRTVENRSQLVTFILKALCVSSVGQR